MYKQQSVPMESPTILMTLKDLFFKRNLHAVLK